MLGPSSVPPCFLMVLHFEGHDLAFDLWRNDRSRSVSVGYDMEFSVLATALEIEDHGAGDFPVGILDGEFQCRLVIHASFPGAGERRLREGGQGQGEPANR